LNTGPKILAVLVAVLLVGCETDKNTGVLHPNISFEEKLFERNIYLSKEHLEDPKLQIRLVSVSSDCTTTIHLNTGEILAAKPGGYYQCESFGNSGLRLESADPKTGGAEFTATWCEEGKPSKQP